MTEAPFRAMDEFDVFMVVSMAKMISVFFLYKKNMQFVFRAILSVFLLDKLVQTSFIPFVYQDAVSRKISLDTLVDFALAQGSQWIFITPHDIR